MTLEFICVLITTLDTDIVVTYLLERTRYDKHELGQKLGLRTRLIITDPKSLVLQYFFFHLSQDD